MCFYIFISMFNSTALIISMDRGVYELHTDNKTKRAALPIVFK